MTNELLGKITYFEAPDDKSDLIDMMIRIKGRTIRVPVSNQEMAVLISQGAKALAGKLP